jgi:hypothetical protein
MFGYEFEFEFSRGGASGLGNRLVSGAACCVGLLPVLVGVAPRFGFRGGSGLGQGCPSSVGSTATRQSAVCTGSPEGQPLSACRWRWGRPAAPHERPGQARRGSLPAQAAQAGPRCRGGAWAASGRLPHRSKSVEEPNPLQDVCCLGGAGCGQAKLKRSCGGRGWAELRDACVRTQAQSCGQ